MFKHSSLRPKGHIWIYGDGPTLEYDTFMCVHCQRHQKVTPGSGRKRGWCSNCNGPTCGKKNCDTCIHWEKKLDLSEAGIPVYDLLNLGADIPMPVKVNVPIIITE